MNSDPTQSNIRSPSAFSLVRRAFGSFLNVSEDQAADEVIIENISNGAQFRGASVWILAFAIFVCSIGLNTNSTAVIIGAMLISPLMGPIMGIGLAIEILDTDLLRRSARNLLIETFVSFLVAAAYFSVSPLTEAQSELLARTTPTVWDVGIAFFGGLAGIIAQSRKVPSTVIPGVAIATALMPPLCTAGYGFATGQYRYFFGAFYLFLINSVFIAVATFVGSKLLRLPKKTFVDAQRRKRVIRWIFASATLTLIPSIVLGYGVVKRSLEQRNLQRFLRVETVFPSTEVLRSRIIDYNGQKRIVLTLVGTPLSHEQIALLNHRLPQYGFLHAQVQVIQQGVAEDDEEKWSAPIFERVLRENEELILNQKQQIEALRMRLSENKGFDRDRYKVWQEIRAQFPNVIGGHLGVAEQFGSNSEKATQQKLVLVVTLKTRGTISNAERSRLTQWLRVRLGIENVDLRVN